MKISGISVTVQRWNFAERPSEFRIRVEEAGGFQYYSTVPVNDDDLVAGFDLIWERLGRSLKKELQKAYDLERP